MSRLTDYREALKTLKNWTPYILKNSGLPGPRGNLELAQVVAEVATPGQIEEFLALPLDKAPENTPGVFLVFCGVTALGKLAARAEHDERRRHRLFVRLRRYASDSRWRVREGVAIALQYVGDSDMKALLEEMQDWSRGNWYEKRAVAAALAEPRLLKEAEIAMQVLRILDGITTAVESAGDARTEAFKVLRQSMGYCWSVAVAAAPRDGKAFMEKWLASRNPDVSWIMKENLKKNRLIKMDARWVTKCVARLASAV